MARPFGRREQVAIKRIRITDRTLSRQRLAAKTRITDIRRNHLLLPAFRQLTSGNKT